MQPNKIMLKFSSEIPIRLENELVSLGFRYFARKKNEWVIYEKSLVPEDPRNEDELDLPEFMINDLRKRLNRIVDSYLDPDAHTAAIRTRCVNMAKTLPPDPRDWVMNWIRQNIDNESNDPPWEDENYQPNMGFC